MSLQDSLNKKAEAKKFFYIGDFNLVDSLARRIPKVGDEYKPIDDIQVEELEYQVKQFRVSKILLGESDGA